MAGIARKGEKEIECPFCRKGMVKTFYKGSFMQSTTTRIAGRKSTRGRVKLEMYDVLENCPNCGKTKKEIQKAIDTGKTKVLSHKERIAMLKKRGLPLVIGGGD